MAFGLLIISLIVWVCHHRPYFLWALILLTLIFSMMHRFRWLTNKFQSRRISEYALVPRTNAGFPQHYRMGRYGVPPHMNGNLHAADAYNSFPIKTAEPGFYGSTPNRTDANLSSNFTPTAHRVSPIQSYSADNLMRRPLRQNWVTPTAGVLFRDDFSERSPEKRSPTKSQAMYEDKAFSDFYDRRGHFDAHGQHRGYL